MSALNLDKCIEQLMRSELLSEQTLKEICEKTKLFLIDEPNIVSIKAPVTVVGDIHGQFYDLLEIFKIGGKCPDTNYLFLGNYVNRGYFSIETLTLLLCLKLRYPHRINLLRGNHESKPITEIYGFYGECMRKYGNANVWKIFTDLFNYFTIAALIDDRLFCVHGGLSQQITSLDQIRVLDRYQDVPATGALTEILWSDPDQEREGFGPSLRGVGCTFGHDAVVKFMKSNNLEHIIRSNQLCMDGYQTLFGSKISTIWSAPNYCYRCGNVAAILELSEQLERYYNTFTACPESERVKPPIDSMKETPDYYTI